MSISFRNQVMKGATSLAMEAIFIEEMRKKWLIESSQDSGLYEVLVH